MSPPESVLSVTDTRAAEFLVDPARRRYLDPFLNREGTVAQVAQELGEATNRVLYRVRAMVALGLLRVVREEPRRGRAVRVYRSVADQLFVPYGATLATDVLDVLLRERIANERVLQSAMVRVMRDVHGEQGRGMLLYRRGDSVYAYDAVRPDEAWHSLGPDDPAVLDYTVTLRGLTHPQAKALQLELLDVLQRHSREAAQQETSAQRRRYLVRLALAPLPEQDAEA